MIILYTIVMWEITLFTLAQSNELGVITIWDTQKWTNLNYNN